MLHTNTRRLWRMLVGLVFAVYGCSSSTSTSGFSLPIFTHIHNDSRAAAAHAAQSAMSEYGKNSPAMYSAMTANVELFKADEDATLAAFAANRSTAFVTRLPGLSMQDFCREAADPPENPDCGANAPPLGTLIFCTGNDISQALSENAQQSHATQTASKSLVDAVAAAQARVKTLKAEVSDWNEQVAFFQLAMQSLPQAETNLDKSKALNLFQDPEALKTLAEKVGSTRFSYVDADGKDQTVTVSKFQNQKFVEISAKISDGNFPNVLTDAPGVDLVLANLVLTLAQLEQKNAQAKLSQQRRLLEVLLKADSELRIADALRKTSEQGIHLRCNSPDGNNLFNELGANLGPAAPDTATEYTRQNKTAALLVAMRETAVAESIVSRTRSALKLDLARLNHINSIYQSQINDEEYQTLISSGIAGLVAYHDGGLTAQDLANVISLAQAAGVGAIAARIH